MKYIFTTSSAFLLLAVFAFTAPILTSSRALAASGESCASLKDSLISKVCVGDLIRNQKTAATGEVVVEGPVLQIEPALSSDGKLMSVLTIRSAQGPVKLTSQGIVFTKPGTCTTPERTGDQVCVGQQFKSQQDGRSYLVTGISVSDGAFGSSGLLVRDLNSAVAEQTTSPSEVYSSRQVAATGKMSRSGSCSSEMPFLHKIGYGPLPACAAKDALDSLRRACQLYCGKSGLLNRNDLKANKAPECQLHPNLFPPHRKACDVTLEARCECAS